VQTPSASRRASALVALALAAAALLIPIQAQHDAMAPTDRLPDAPLLDEVRAYIDRTWSTLTRSLADLPAAAHDPKFARGGARAWPVYVPREESMAAVRARVDAALPAAQRRHVQLLPLPARARDIRQHGLLYLPHPYVVPGGRFNEMYGWDSYFIVLGLLRDHRVDLARAMADNHLYQVKHYGTVLNANRTYYLTRSQPPFLSRMVLGVYAHTQDRAWLRAALPLVEKHYRYWLGPPHEFAGVGLSRYYDLGEGPAPEVVADEKDAEGRTHYERVRDFYRAHEVRDYRESLFYDPARHTLTPRFYKGDRTMRESGFDPSDRFGAFGVDVISYAAVCLNSLLYQMETDLAAMHDLLGEAAEAGAWRQRAVRRAERVEALLWDEPAGLYFDYHVEERRRRTYAFATTFFPLWVGLASKAHAARVAANLPTFEAPGGLLTSTTESGSQWDAPFGWAPLQLAAVEGLRRYGFTEDADRLSRKFVTLVAKEFQEHRVIVEKYDVVRRESDVSAGIRFGYASNEVGFGWTNGVVLELLAGLER
jgi:alpha,alpha-trehalase